MVCVSCHASTHFSYIGVFGFSIPAHQLLGLRGLMLGVSPWFFIVGVMGLFLQSYEALVEVIRTILVARKRKGVFRRQTLALEYGVYRKASSVYLSPSVPCVLSVSVRPSSVHGGRRPCPSVVRFPDWEGI